MPEDTKKNQKGKHDAKEQRRKQQPRQAGPVDKKQEKEPDKPQVNAKEQRRKRQSRQADPVDKKQEQEHDKPQETPKAVQKPVYEPPGPEFYKGLKRETDEILKITEEENSKYKKKEIQSNWSKYEMPIESYEEMEEQQQLGADYETLIQAPLSVGTHFQFKHEKSWDITSGPSPYEKYFDIDMDNLVVALSTIPFYERNNIDKSLFTESEFKSMDHRATKFKQKYYNDSKYNTPDLEAQNDIISKLCNKNEDSEKCDKNNDSNLLEYNNIQIVDSELRKPELESSMESKVEEMNPKEGIEMDQFKSEGKLTNSKQTLEKQEIAIEDDPIVANDNVDDNLSVSHEDEVKEDKVPVPVPNLEESLQVTSPLQKEPNNPIIESPEDLEKWLDDFLDG